MDINENANALVARIQQERNTADRAERSARLIRTLVSPNTIHIHCKPEPGGTGGKEGMWTLKVEFGGDSNPIVVAVPPQRLERILLELRRLGIEFNAYVLEEHAAAAKAWLDDEEKQLDWTGDK